MLKLVGILLNLAGVLSLWFGGIPYKTKETVVNLGPVKAEVEVDKRAEIPPPVGAGLVAVGTVLLLLPTRRRG